MKVPAQIAFQKRHRRRISFRHDAHTVAATLRTGTRFCNLVGHMLELSRLIPSPFVQSRGRIWRAAHSRRAVFVDARTNLAGYARAVRFTFDRARANTPTEPAGKK
jgi:hypothetical protein